MIRIIDHEGNGYGAQAEITRKKGVNGEKSLTGVIYTNDEVLHGVDRGWKLEFENEIYAFTFAFPKDTGNRIELEFDAVHEFFYDMSKSAQNDLLSDGSHTFKAYLDFIFRNTAYNYVSDVDVSAFEKETFGQKNRLDLFYDVINTAGVEFSVSGSVVRIVEKIGNDLSTIVKKGFNLNELRLEKNIGDFVTYQKGFGAWNDEEDHSKGRLEVEYLSPLAEIYGKLDADPVVDERYTVRGNLLTRLQNNVEGSYQISVQIDMEDLTRAGYEYKQPHEGDSIMAINNDLGFQRKVRIVSYETDFDVEGNILDHRITCNSVGMVEQSISSTNNIRYAINELQNDLELARQQITEARVSADGKSMNYYGPVEPRPEDYKLSIGDTWFDTSSEDTVIKAWNGVEWRNVGLDSEALQRQFREFEQNLEETKETIDNRLTDLNDDIADSFTDLDVEILAIETISNAAQLSASTALDNSQTALNDASVAMDRSLTAIDKADGAISSISNINVEIDEINGTLDLKADSQTVNALDGTVSNLSTEVGVIAGELSAKADSSLVDTISGIVDNHTLDIRANAEGLAVKADSSRVDTLEGAVSSLGTEFDVVAGKVSSKVWMADIDDLSYENRNLILNSYFSDDLDNWYSSGIVSVTDEGVLLESRKGRSDRIQPEVLLKKGKYTLTVWYQTLEGDGPYFFPSNGSKMSMVEGSKQGNFKKSDSPQKDVFYIEIYEDDSPIDSFRYASGSPTEHLEGKFNLFKIKLEKGSNNTPYSTAPEDTDAKFDYVESEMIQRYDSITSTVSSIDGRVSSQEQRVDSITTTIQEVTESVNGNTTLINQTVSTVNTHTQTIATIETDLEGKATVAQYNTLVSTVDGSIQRIGNAEGDITQIETSIEGLQTQVFNVDGTSRITQLSTLIDARVTTDEMENAISISEQGILAQTVLEGEVVARINQEAGTTLIENNRIYLAAETVAFTGSAFIPGAYIENASIDSAKISEIDANQVNVININANSIAGNEANLITAMFSGNYSQLRLTSNSVGMMRTTQGGYAFEITNNEARLDIATSIYQSLDMRANDLIFGTRLSLSANALPGNWLEFRTSGSLRAKVGSEALDLRTPLLMNNNSISLGGGQHIASPGNVVQIMANSNVRLSVSDSNVNVYETLEMNGNNIGLRQGRLQLNDSTILSPSVAQLQFNVSATRRMLIGNNTINMYRNLDMNSYIIGNESDLREKTDIIDTEVSSLEEIKSWHFVDYRWIDPEKPEGRHFGLIAQHTSMISMYDSETDKWSINSSKQLMMTTHAVQQLSLAHDNTNIVASEALIKAEETNILALNNKSEIDLLKEENKELRTEIQKLKEAA